MRSCEINRARSLRAARPVSARAAAGRPKYPRPFGFIFLNVVRPTASARFTSIQAGGSRRARARGTSPGRTASTMAVSSSPECLSIRTRAPEQRRDAGMDHGRIRGARSETVEEHLHPAVPLGGALDEGHGPEVSWIRLRVGEHEPPEAVAGETANDLSHHPLVRMDPGRCHALEDGPHAPRTARLRKGERVRWRCFRCGTT